MEHIKYDKSVVKSLRNDSVNEIITKDATTSTDNPSIRDSDAKLRKKSTYTGTVSRKNNVNTVKHKGKNGWNEKNELRCEIILKKSSAYIYLIGKTMKYYDNLKSRWEVCIIILTYILGAGGIPSLIATDNVDTIRVINLIIQGLIIALGVAKTIYQWIDYDRKIKDFAWSYHKYTDLYVKIEKQLNLVPKNRKRFNDFYEKIQKIDFEIQRKTPEIPKNIINNYYKKMGTLAVKKPILFGTVNMVEMYLRDPNDYCISPNDSNQNLFEETEEFVERVRKSSIDTRNNEFHFNNEIAMKKNYELDRFFHDFN